ncbi:hypothetical protein LY71_1255 [Geodermatophilus tzadiensis]|uniref:Glycosyl hydrolase family 28 n=1 Tax=Geodermatophilus tzadiensis TaxID=1137988 RepID=A0A2T0ST38_9ACTN|nr:hypothetical protein LY71_1255 [Geodermatophilus tzadiensis]
MNQGLAVTAPEPSGEDDSATLAALCVGRRDVHLRSGATYVIAARDAISQTGFTGRIVGNGATLKFTYTGPWSESYSAINGLHDVTLRDLSITAPDANLFSIFRDCTNLHLDHVTVYACSPKLTYALPKDFSAHRIRWISEGDDPSVIDGSLYVPDAGRFSLTDFDYDATFTGRTGAIVSAVATRTAPGATVYVANGRAFTADRPGHSADGFIDIEPIGDASFDNVTVRDVVLYNTSCYLTGARNVTVDNCTFVYTANNSSGRAIPFVVYNHNEVKPPLGALHVRNCRVEWTAGNPADQTIGVMTYQSHPGAVVRFTDNSYHFSPAVGQVVQDLYWVKDGAPAIMSIHGDAILEAGDIAHSQALIRTDSTVRRLLVREMSVSGTFAQKLQAGADGGGGEGDLVVFESNDFTGATFTGADSVASGVTLRRRHSTDNAGIEY